MENYGLAIMDSEEIIKINPAFTKAYYRKGTAYLLLGKFDKAKDDFKMANKLTIGKDQDIVEKLK